MATRRRLIYDISRLTTRILSRTPNGIDRVDFAMADYFIDPARDDRSGLLFTTIGPRVLSPQAAREAIDIVHANWGEHSDPDADPEFTAMMSALRGPPTMPLRWSRTRMGRGSAAWGWFTRHGIRVGHKPRNFVGPGGVYLNVSQFPLESERYFRLIKSSGDMDLVFFIHDLLPLQMPEYFKPREHALHRRRLQNLARFARAAIVSSNVVKEALERHLLSLGRIDMPILVAPLPVDPIFSQRIEAPEQSARPYFLMCGTIEPRKNHLLVLHVWRRLVEEMGEQAPTLVLVGARGWENEHIVDLLERCPNLQKHVVEISGLETPALRRLLAGACAALMPTFAEGYGLPLVEALAAGTPVIASDIQVFREIGGDHVIRLDPTDGPAWLRTIRDFAAAPSPLRRSRVKALADYRPPSWTTFFARIEDFVADFDNR